MTSSSPFYTDLVPREMGYSGPVAEIGSPRNDVLVRATDEDRLEIRRRLGISDDQRVLLFAPTFRDYLRHRWSAAPVTHLDLNRLADDLGPSWTIIARGHSFNARHGTAYDTHERVLDLTSHHDINHLYLAADATVTDYSSVMFDVVLTGRPLLFFVPDFELYVRSRGVYFDLPEVAPGPWCTTYGQLLESLQDLDVVHKEHAEKYQAFVERFAPWDDGLAAARLVDRMLGEQA